MVSKILLLAFGSRDLSQVQQKIIFVASWATHKMTLIPTQPSQVKLIYKFLPSQKLVHLSGYFEFIQTSHMWVVNFPKICAKSSMQSLAVLAVRGTFLSHLLLSNKNKILSLYITTVIFCSQLESNPVMPTADSQTTYRPPYLIQ